MSRKSALAWIEQMDAEKVKRMAINSVKAKIDFIEYVDRVDKESSFYAHR